MNISFNISCVLSEVLLRLPGWLDSADNRFEILLLNGHHRRLAQQALLNSTLVGSAYAGRELEFVMASCVFFEARILFSLRCPLHCGYLKRNRCQETE